MEERLLELQQVLLQEMDKLQEEQQQLEEQLVLVVQT